jgi:hypothetical protein
MACWCRVTVFGPDGSPVSTGLLEGPGLPDIATVDGIAQQALFARRTGRRLVLSEVAPELMELLDLVAIPVEVSADVSPDVSSDA